MRKFKRNVYFDRLISLGRAYRYTNVIFNFTVRFNHLMNDYIGEVLFTLCWPAAELNHLAIVFIEASEESIAAGELTVWNLQLIFCELYLHVELTLCPQYEHLKIHMTYHRNTVGHGLSLAYKSHAHRSSALVNTCINSPPQLTLIKMKYAATCKDCEKFQLLLFVQVGAHLISYQIDEILRDSKKTQLCEPVRRFIWFYGFALNSSSLMYNKRRFRSVDLLYDVRAYSNFQHNYTENTLFINDHCSYWFFYVYRFGLKL